MTTGERIKLRRKELGISAEKVAAALSVSPATIYRYEKGAIEKVPGDLLEPLAKVLATTPAYLMGWSDAPEVKDPPNSYPVDPSHVAPVIGSVAAGPGLVPREEIDGYYVLPPQLKNAEEYRYFRVKGNSMEPEISDGQMVLVHIQPDVKNGEIAVVIVNGDEGVVKRVQKEKDCLVLLSANPAYPPRVVMGQELKQTIIWGKVAYAWREF